MSKWKWLIIVLDVCAALLGVYCLGVGERACVSVVIGALLLDACKGHLKE